MNGLPIGRILGFEVRVHLSWVIIVALVAVLVVDQLETIAPELSTTARWVIAAIIAFAFFASVLVHELGHAVVARRRGLKTGPITLYFFGAAASVEAEPENARDELAVASSGPAISLAIGAILTGGGLVTQGIDTEAFQAASAALLVIGVLNLLLGAINLVPAFPLDGGRVLRAIVWSATGDERRGMRAAGFAGRAVGWLLIGAGLAIVVTGDMVDGFMLALSGWFLANAARGIARRLAVEDLLRSVRVEDVMERNVPTVPPQLTLDTFVERLFGEDGTITVPVVRGDTILGVIGPAQLRSVAESAWPTTHAEQIMAPLGDQARLSPGETVWTGLDRLRRTGLDGLPVTDATGLLGVLTRRNVVRTIHSQAQLRGVPLP